MSVEEKKNDPYSSPVADDHTNVLAEESVKFWVPQAMSMAERGKSLILITQFLRSKGVSQEIAQLAAAEIFNKGSKREHRRKLPVLIVGYFLLSVGILTFIIFTLLGGGFNPGVALAALLPGVLGCALLWGGFLQGSTRH